MAAITQQSRYRIAAGSSRVRGQHYSRPCRGAMYVKSVESSNVFPLVWCGSQEREVPARVSSSSLDHGSKTTTFVAKSPRAAEQYNVNFHSLKS
ncbi:hypothetical protein TNCV_2987771 [Trichonephila clavipes]|nr:hypothetical protein TNCV_2987771 [Trichonephila clavipes]